MQVQEVRQAYQALRGSSDCQERLNEMANFLAMQALSLKDFETARRYLQEADSYCRDNLFRQSVTLNNWACFHKYQGEFQTAKGAIQQSLRILASIRDTLTPVRCLQCRADSHLNLCAIHSALGSHSVALKHCQQAVALLRKELAITQSQDRAHVLMIACFNQAVEYEHLRLYPQARTLYAQALQVCEQYALAPGSLADRIQKGLQSCSGKGKENAREGLPALVPDRSDRLSLKTGKFSVKTSCASLCRDVLRPPAGNRPKATSVLLRAKGARG
jgi:tetratricopeptide (TPR) repeat protein